MGNKCDVDIHEIHAELIHKARDVEFQIVYDNGGSPALISDIDNKNLQTALESYFSKVGIPVKNEKPIGSKNSVNLTFLTQNEFIPGTLEVYLSGLKLNGDQTDVERDYTVFSTGPNAYQGFVLELEPNDAHRLNVPPFQEEALFVNYSKRITFNTKGGT